MTKVQICGDRAFEIGSTDLYTGHIPVLSEEIYPVIKWTGEKLPWNDYCSICSFFRWTYKEFKSEAQLRVFYSMKEKKFAIAVYPQKSIGLHTEEIEDHPKRRDYDYLTKNNYEQCMTFHHHNGASAFQSGTDHKDEQHQTGLHVTIGHIDQEELEVHARTVFRGYQYKGVDLSSWIDIPVGMGEIPQKLKDIIVNYFMCNPQETAFPEEWKSMMIQEVKVAQTGLAYRFGNTYDLESDEVAGFRLPAAYKQTKSDVKEDEKEERDVDGRDFAELLDLADSVIFNGLYTKDELIKILNEQLDDVDNVTEAREYDEAGVY